MDWCQGGNPTTLKEIKMEKGKCYECGTSIGAETLGMCHRCAQAYHEQREKKYPFVVRFGNGDSEEFETRREAEVLLGQLKSSYIEERG